MRILSLLPSATEIVCELGLIDELVGISHDCDWPPEVRGKPVLSQAAVTSDLSSSEIDRTVREIVHHGLSVYHLDAERLRDLEPDLILTQELCEVCAPSFSEVMQAAKVLDTEPKIVSLEPTRLSEILDNIELVGRLTHRTAQARQRITRLNQRIERVRRRAESAEERPRTLALEWLEPLFLAGHWVPEMIELAGGEPLGETAEPSYEIEWGELERFDPEVLVLMPCGFTPEHTLQELDLLTAHEGWEELRAVKNEQVYVVHGSYYFNRPGPRIVTGLEILARLIHPEIFRDLALPQGSVYPIRDPLV
jgi:iron complex transport system substrate-binding protein